MSDSSAQEGAFDRVCSAALPRWVIHQMCRMIADFGPVCCNSTKQCRMRTRVSMRFNQQWYSAFRTKLPKLLFMERSPSFRALMQCANEMPRYKIERIFSDPGYGLTKTCTNAHLHDGKLYMTSLLSEAVSICEMPNDL